MASATATTTSGRFWWYTVSSHFDYLQPLVSQSGVAFGSRYNWRTVLRDILSHRSEQIQHESVSVLDLPIDELCHERYTHKIQKSIRRLWHSDILTAWPDSASKYRVLFSMGYDTSSANSIILTDYMYGSPVYNAIHDYGIHASEFKTVFSTLADKVKAAGLHNTTDDVYWIPESKNLGGYTYDFDPEDIYSQVLNLSSGGLAVAKVYVEGLSDRQAFVSSLHHVTSNAAINTSTFSMTFEEYVRSFSWDTAGASSFGSLHMTFEGEDYDIKARKNMLKFIYTPDQIWHYVTHNRRQVNKCFIKHELGKARVAVTSDLATYLRQSYISEIIGKTYLNWLYFTLEETEANMLQRLRRSFKYNYFIPYDYKSFDLQPSGLDIQDMVRVICDWAKKCCPTVLYSELDSVIGDVFYGFAHADLISTIPGAEYRGSIEGGISSGLRWTSLIGNLYNAARMHMAVRLAGTESQVDLYVRGDDTVIMSSSLRALDITLAALDLIGAIPNSSKFSVQSGAFEFLRTWYTPTSVRGYPSRSAISMLQRKPWANAPVSRLAELTVIVDSHYTTCRRARIDPDSVKDKLVTLLYAWCRNVGISTTVLRYPIQRGGLALIPTNYSVVGDASQKMMDSKQDISGKITVQLALTAGDAAYSQAIRVCNDHSIPYRIRAPDVVLKMLDVLETDAVPQFSAIYKKTDPWRKHRFKTVLGSQSEYIPSLYGRESLWRLAMPDDQLSKAAELHLPRHKHGKYRRDARLISIAGEVSLLSGLETKHVLAQLVPGYISDLNRLVNRGLHRSVAEGWLLGSVSRHVVYPCHSVFSDYISNAVAFLIDSLLTGSRLFPPGLMLYTCQLFSFECCRQLAKLPLYSYFLF